MPVTFGCSMPSRGAMSSPDSLRSLAQRAEALAYDSIWVSDHIVLPRQVASFYPYAENGVATFTPDQPYYEPIATLNFLAGCTQRVRLGTHVLIIPYRNPVTTAKQLSTLDVLSRRQGNPGGRAWVGWRKSFRPLAWTHLPNEERLPTSTCSFTRNCGPRNTPSFRVSISRFRAPDSSPSRCKSPTYPFGSAATPAPRFAGQPNWQTDGCPSGYVHRRFWSLKRWPRRLPGCVH